MKIGFFGSGNMARALASGMRKHSHSHELYFYNPTLEKSKKCALDFKGIFIQDLSSMPMDLDWYFLTFKPQSLGSFNFTFRSDSKIVSVLAGVLIETLALKFQANKIVRVMPNTPSSIGEGVNLIYGQCDYSSLIPLLKSAGALIELQSESLIDQLTPFSGSGPALIFEFARQFEENIYEIVKDQSLSRQIVQQLFLGSSALIKNGYLEKKSLFDLREEVTSKKGVTYEALKVLEEHKLSNIMKEAFQSAYNRALELQKGV